VQLFISPFVKQLLIKAFFAPGLCRGIPAAFFRNQGRINVKRNNGLFLFFVVFFAIAGLWFALGSLSLNSFSDDTAAGLNILQGALVYQPPAGYGQMSFGVPFLLKGVMMGPLDPSNGFSMMLVQSPFLNASNGEEFVRGLHSKYRSTTLDVNWRAAGTTPVWINGQFVTMTVKEGANASGCVYRNLSAVLHGKNGAVVLVVTGLASQWDGAAFNSLVQTIKY